MQGEGGRALKAGRMGRARGGQGERGGGEQLGREREFDSSLVFHDGRKIVTSESRKENW